MVTKINSNRALVETYTSISSIGPMVEMSSLTSSDPNNSYHATSQTPKTAIAEQEVCRTDPVARKMKKTTCTRNQFS